MNIKHEQDNIDKAGIRFTPYDYLKPHVTYEREMNALVTQQNELLDMQIRNLCWWIVGGTLGIISAFLIWYFGR